MDRQEWIDDYIHRLTEAALAEFREHQLGLAYREDLTPEQAAVIADAQPLMGKTFSADDPLSARKR